MIRLGNAAVVVMLLSSTSTLFAAETPIPPDLRKIDAKTPKEVQMAIALAAGPPVSAGAGVYVLGPHGYEKVRESSNGFNCVIERQRLDTMEPMCYDAQGTATNLQVTFFVEEERALGKRDGQILETITEGYKSGRFIAPSKPGLVYMLSDYNYTLNPATKQIEHFPAHLMFYAPKLTAKDVGQGPGAPLLTDPGQPDNLMVVAPDAHVHNLHVSAAGTASTPPG
jgi:hypothetical protein